MVAFSVQDLRGRGGSCPVENPEISEFPGDIRIGRNCGCERSWTVVLKAVPTLGSSCIRQ